jgi:hypothetical protein
MQWIPLVAFLFVVTGLYSLFLKISAALLRYRIEWTHAAIFAVLMGIVSLAANVGSAVTGHRGALTVLALVVLISIGAWFFSARGARANGQQIGAKGGAMLVGLALAVSIGIGLLLIVLVQLLRSTA